MNRLLVLLATVALLWFPIEVEATELIELADLQMARSVGATIEDPTGAPIPNAQVREFSADWKTELRSGSTDARGNFSFKPAKDKKIYFIQVSAPGFDSLRFRLQIAKQAVDLKLKLTVAT
jgi:hypothetical protein